MRDVQSWEFQSLPQIGQLLPTREFSQVSSVRLIEKWVVKLGYREPNENFKFSLFTLMLGWVICDSALAGKSGKLFTRSLKDAKLHGVIYYASSF